MKEFAETLVREAGETLLQHFHKAQEVSYDQSGVFAEYPQAVSNVEIEIENRMINQISQTFPEHNILAECASNIDKGAEYSAEQQTIHKAKSIDVVESNRPNDCPGSCYDVDRDQGLGRRTQANVEGRWQGQGDWGLDDLGRQQAQALVDWYGRTSTVYSSPLGRARQTAAYVASNGVIEVDDLRELAMGEWEGLTSPEIAERWGDRMETIYRHGVDLKRGETGESWGELTARFRSAVHALETAPGEPTVVVAHGGAIRSYVSSLTALDDSNAESLFTPANTSVTHVAMTPDGPLLLDYAVAPHLESIT